MKKNCNAIFPALNIEHLEFWTNKLANYHDYIKTVMLYPAPIGYRYGIKYIVVIEPFKPEIDGSVITNRLKIFEDMISNFSYPPEWHERMRDFYIQPPHDGYLDEWQFLLRTPPALEKMPSCTLFDRTTITLDSPIIKNLIQKVYPEVEVIYKAIKKVGFSARVPDNRKKWREAALEQFDSKPGKFKYLKRGHIEDEHIYKVNVQHKRGLVGSILKKITIEYGYGKYGGQELYTIYTSIHGACKSD